MGQVEKVAISLILAAALLPAALGIFFGTDTTGWDVSTVAIWTVIPVIALLGVFLGFRGRGGGAE